MQQLVEEHRHHRGGSIGTETNFQALPYNNLAHGEWIRHLDVKTADDLNEHNKCLIYHEKGTRGKGKGISITWNHITE